MTALTNRGAIRSHTRNLRFLETLYPALLRYSGFALRCSSRTGARRLHSANGVASQSRVGGATATVERRFGDRPATVDELPAPERRRCRFLLRGAPPVLWSSRPVSRDVEPGRCVVSTAQIMIPTSNATSLPSGTPSNDSDRTASRARRSISSVRTGPVSPTCSTGPVSGTHVSPQAAPMSVSKALIGSGYVGVSASMHAIVSACVTRESA